MDFLGVGYLTPGATDHGNLDLLKIVWSGSTGSKSAPAGDPTFGTVNWCINNGIRKTNQVYAANKRERKISRVAERDGSSCTMVALNITNYQEIVFCRECNVE